MDGRFQLRHRVKPERAQNETDKDYKMRCDKAQAQEKAFFNKVLAPGTAVIMTLEANLLNNHWAMWPKLVYRRRTRGDFLSLSYYCVCFASDSVVLVCY